MFILTVKNSAGQIVHKRNFESGSFVIGRDDGCDLVIVSAGVSRKHARIFTQQNRCLIEDLASANGIIVDGQKVIGQRDLGTASQIQIGEHFLFLHQNDAKFDIGATLFVTDDDQHCKLVRINDGFAGEEYNLSEVGNTIGRIDENFILLSDNSISRHHAQITRTGFIYNLSDLQSSNGTKLNGKKIKKSVELTPGDRIEFGNLQFVFVMGGTEVNLKDYREVKRSPLPIVVIGALIFLVVLFLAFSSNDVEVENNDDTPQKVEEPFATKKARALKWIASKEYTKAIPLLRELRAVEDGLEINTLLENTISAEKSGKLLNEANRLIEADEYWAAIDILKTVETGTPARKVADGQIQKLENMLATRYKNEADKLTIAGTRKSLKKAHDEMRKALSIKKDLKWIVQMRAIESRLKKEKIRFIKWKKP